MKTIEINGALGFEYTYAQLAESTNASNGDDITYIINSPGGSVTDGFAMIAAMRAYKTKYPKAKITTELRGMAASMAPVVGGSKFVDWRKAEDNATFMIHNPFILAIGDYRDMKVVSEKLDAYSHLYAKTLAERNTAGKKEKEIREMMDAAGNGTWLFGNKIKEMGFVDEIIPAGDGAEDEPTAMALAHAEYERVQELMRSKGKDQDAQAVAMSDVMLSTLPGNTGSNDTIHPAGEGEEGMEIKCIADVQANYPAVYAEAEKTISASAVAKERERVKVLGDARTKWGKVGAIAELIDAAIADGREYSAIAGNVADLALAAADSPGSINANGVGDGNSGYVPISIIHN